MKSERLMNRAKPVDMEQGQFFIVKNPDSPNPFLENQKGRFPHTITDLTTGQVTKQTGLKPALA